MLRMKLEHKVNPLHIYCRLVGMKINKKKSMKLAKVYEMLIYWIMKGGKHGNNTEDNRKT